MVNEDYSLEWTKKSQSDMLSIFNYISEDSVLAAQKMVNDIAEAVEKTLTNPERHSPDKFKMNNDGTYRAFELHHYRVSYRFENKVVRVLRVRHTKRIPKSY